MNRWKIEQLDGIRWILCHDSLCWDDAVFLYYRWKKEYPNSRFRIMQTEDN